MKRHDIIEMVILGLIIVLILSAIVHLKVTERDVIARLTALEQQATEHESYHMAGGDPSFDAVKDPSKPRVR